MQEGMDACGARRSPLQAGWPRGCEAEACGKLANYPGSGPAPPPPSCKRGLLFLLRFPGAGLPGMLALGRRPSAAEEESLS